MPSLGCGLIGVEPDEIDILEGETGNLTDPETSDPSGDETGEDTFGPTDSGDGDGDGDPGTGDGDGDPPDTGDGDGDPQATGDGDGEPATGDGDGDSPCDEVVLTDAQEGDNAIDIADGVSVLTTSCSVDGPEQAFYFVPVAGGMYDLQVDASAPVTLYVIDDNCSLEPQLACADEPGPNQLLSVMLNSEEPVLIVVDSVEGAVTGNLSIQALP